MVNKILLLEKQYTKKVNLITNIFGKRFCISLILDFYFIYPAN